MSIFKIGLPGTDIHHTRLADEVVDSLYPSPKINAVITPPHAGIIFVNWQTTGITLAQGLTKIIYSFQHGYNYIPSVFAAMKFDNGTNQFHGTLPLIIGSIGVLLIDSDPLNINLKYQSIDTGLPPVDIPPFTLRARYYVMAEPGYQLDGVNG